MRNRVAIRSGRARDPWIIGTAFLFLCAGLDAQDLTSQGVSGAWQNYDWLNASSGSAAGGHISSTAGQDLGDPFAVVSTGSLEQEKYDVTYTRPLVPTLALAYQTDAVTVNDDSAALSNESPDDLSNGQKASLQFQPSQQWTLSGNVHGSSDDEGSPDCATETRGGGFTAESELPLKSVLTLGMNSDSTLSAGSSTGDSSYDAQLKQPLGKLPVTAVLKGHYEETNADGSPTSRLPSLEQSLVWKPTTDTTVQMGLRQQHYQDFPGIDNALNEAVFADWSQAILPAVSWHSYAEVLNSQTRAAPAVPTTSGANGTAQTDDPANAMTMPSSLNDETITFTTGPSVKLSDDMSASLEYSNRVDRDPAPGDMGQEQRVSVSLKGNF